MQVNATAKAIGGLASGGGPGDKRPDYADVAKLYVIERILNEALRASRLPLWRR